MCWKVFVCVFHIVNKVLLGFEISLRVLTDSSMEKREHNGSKVSLLRCVMHHLSAAQLFHWQLSISCAHSLSLWSLKDFVSFSCILILEQVWSFFYWNGDVSKVQIWCCLVILYLLCWIKHRAPLGITSHIRAKKK